MPLIAVQLDRHSPPGAAGRIVRAQRVLGRFVLCVSGLSPELSYQIRRRQSAGGPLGELDWARRDGGRHSHRFLLLNHAPSEPVVFAVLIALGMLAGSSLAFHLL